MGSGSGHDHCGVAKVDLVAKSTKIRGSKLRWPWWRGAQGEQSQPLLVQVLTAPGNHHRIGTLQAGRTVADNNGDEKRNTSG